MSKPRHECRNTCGGTDKMEGISWSLEQYGAMRDHRAMAGVLDEFCRYEIVITFILRPIFQFS